MSEDIKKEIRKELEDRHYMALKSYNDNDDLEFHRVFLYQDTLLAKRNEGDPVSIDTLLGRDLVEMYVTDDESYIEELLEEEVI